MNPDAMAKRMMQQAYNRDGLAEVAAGLTLLAAAALIYAQLALPGASKGFNIAFTVLIPLMCLGARPALRWVRERYLVARVGYVQHYSPPRKYMVASAAIGLSMMPVLFFLEPRAGVLLGATGVLGGVLTAMIGRSPRFLIAGILMAVVGLAVGGSGVSLNEGFAALFGFQGLLLVLTGAVVFARFIRQPA